MKKAVKKTIEKSPKYVTEKLFDVFATSTAKRFDGIDQRFDGIDQRFDVVDQRLENLEAGISTIIKMNQANIEEAREHRLAMSVLTHSDVKQGRQIDELFERVEKLERKSATK